MKKVANIGNALWYIAFLFFPNPDTHGWLGLGYQFFYYKRRNKLIAWLQEEQKNCASRRFFRNLKA